MEQLKFIPITMFLTGILLMYSGFKGIKPIDVLRQNIGSLDQPGGPNLYTESTNPYYAGVPQYVRPGGMGPVTFN